MSARETKIQQAERILAAIREESDFSAEVPQEVTVEDVSRRSTDLTVPFPVNLNRMLEQLVEEYRVQPRADALRGILDSQGGAAGVGRELPHCGKTPHS